MGLNEFFQTHKIPTFPLDGKFHALDSRWGRGVQTSSGKVKIVVGTWSTGHKLRYESEALTPEEVSEFKVAEENAERILKERHAQAAVEAEDIYSSANDAGTHPYLSNKKISKLHGAKIDVTTGDLIIPMYKDARLTGVQRISSTGYKQFILGSDMKGAHCTMGAMTDTILIAEGFATAASCHEATGYYTVCAFNAGNLARVAMAMKLLYPSSQLVLCADDDHETLAKTGTNPGIANAKSAASRVGAKVVLPVWGHRARGSGTDFNDLHCQYGTQIVADCISSQLAPNLPAELPFIHCMSTVNAKGKVILPSDDLVARAIRDKLAGSWRANSQDVFMWQGTHWTEHTYDEICRTLTPVIETALGGNFTHSKLVAIQNYLITKSLPMMGDVHQANSCATAFRNGTLRILQDGLKKSLLFEPSHDKEDKLLNCLPFDLDMSDDKPEEFLSWVRDHLLAGTQDIDAQILLLQEVIGSCLLPHMPVVTFFTGMPKTGKSTILKLISSLMSPANVCSVDPTNMHGFGIEPMLGKLINVLTDLNTANIIDVDTVKRIADRVPVDIQRKFRTNVKAFIPAVHLFATNLLPRIGDDTSGALERRVRIFTCNNVVQGTGVPEFHLKFLQGDGQRRLVAWAYQGLARVIAQNDYTYPLSMQQTATMWTLRDDRPAQYLEALAAGETSLIRNDTGKVPRIALKTSYIAFINDMRGKVSNDDLHRLYAKFDQSRDKHGRYIHGLSEKGSF